LSDQAVDFVDTRNCMVALLQIVVQIMIDFTADLMFHGQVIQAVVANK